MDYQGKIIVITAAASGIGREAALEFARRGAKVLVSDYDSKGAKAVAREIEDAGGVAIGMGCDVGSDADVAALAETAFGRFGRVDILMNHAGVGAGGPVDRVPLDDWRWVFEINVLGIARALNAFMPGMTKQGEGLIINTASGLGVFTEVPFVLPYITTKAGVIGLSEALALYCKRLGIRVMTLLPDITKTGFHYSGRMTGLDGAKMAQMLPLHQEQLPSDVVRALMSAIDEGRFLACNIPNYEQLLLDKARELYEPAFRVYPTIESAMQEHWPVID